MKRSWQKNTVISHGELQHVLQMKSSGLGTTFSYNVQAANEQLHLIEIHLWAFWKELNTGNSTQTKSRDGLDFCLYLSYIRLDLTGGRTRVEVKYICWLSICHALNANGPVHNNGHEQCSPWNDAGLSFRMPSKQTKVQKFIVPSSLYVKEQCYSYLTLYGMIQLLSLSRLGLAKALLWHEPLNCYKPPSKSVPEGQQWRCYWRAATPKGSGFNFSRLCCVCGRLR